MLNIFGVRAMIGTVLIKNAISVFGKTLKALESGMVHLRAEVKKHQDNVAQSQAKIDDLNQEIRKANVFATNIKNLLGE